MPHSMSIPEQKTPAIRSAAVEREAKQARYEKALDELLKRGDVSSAYQVMLALFVVQHSQARRILSEEQLDQILPALEKNASKQAEAVKHWGWAFTVAGNLAALALIGFGDKLSLTASMDLRSRIDVSNPLKDFISSISQPIGAKSQADQTILDNAKKRLDLTSQRVQEISSSEANKLAKMIDSIQRVLDQNHQGFSQMRT